jgi:hypothetical protein
MIEGSQLTILSLLVIFRILPCFQHAAKLPCGKGVLVSAIRLFLRSAAEAAGQMDLRIA